MKFSATLRGVAYSDPKEFAAAVKAAPPLKSGSERVGRKVAVPRVALPPKTQPIFVKPRVTLTAVEREWLGATVRRSDGLVAQVWSLAPSRPGNPVALWLVANGDYVRADLCEVTLVQSRADQLEV
jgi:hypothetical protein